MATGLGCGLTVHGVLVLRVCRRGGGLAQDGAAHGASGFVCWPGRFSATGPRRAGCCRVTMSWTGQSAGTGGRLTAYGVLRAGFWRWAWVLGRRFTGRATGALGERGHGWCGRASWIAVPARAIGGWAPHRRMTVAWVASPRCMGCCGGFWRCAQGDGPGCSVAVSRAGRLGLGLALGSGHSGPWGHGGCGRPSWIGFPSRAIGCWRRTGGLHGPGWRAHGAWGVPFDPPAGAMRRSRCMGLWRDIGATRGLGSVLTGA